MPDKQRHLEQAQHNETAYHFLGSASPPFIDWQVTSLFYAALHYVDAYLATKGIHPHDHMERDGWIAKLTELKPIAAEYFELKDRSMDARYLRANLPQGVQVDLFSNAFTSLRTHIIPLMPM